MEKEMVTYSNTVAWIIPWIEEAGGLQSMESQKLNMTEWLSKQQNRKSLYLKDDTAIICNAQSQRLIGVNLDSYAVKEIEEFNEPVIQYIESGKYRFALLKSGIYAI